MYYGTCDVWTTKELRYWPIVGVEPRRQRRCLGDVVKMLWLIGAKCQASLALSLSLCVVSLCYHFTPRVGIHMTPCVVHYAHVLSGRVSFWPCLDLFLLSLSPSLTCRNSFKRMDLIRTWFVVKAPFFLSQDYLRPPLPPSRYTIIIYYTPINTLNIHLWCANFVNFKGWPRSPNQASRVGNLPGHSL